MNSNKLRRLCFSSCKLNPQFLGLAWISGLLIGIMVSYSFPCFFLGLDRDSFFAIPSVYTLLIANLIPIVVSFLLLKFSFKFLCYPFLLLVGVFVGFCGIGLYFLFADSAWLIRFVLTFSHSFAILFSWLMILRYIKVSRIYLQNDFIISLIIISVITVLDANLITPVLSEMYTTI